VLNGEEESREENRVGGCYHDEYCGHESLAHIDT